MQALLAHIKSKAKKLNKHIVLAEGTDSRVVRAAGELSQNNFCRVTLLGDNSSIQSLAKELDVDISLVTIVNPAKSKYMDAYATKLVRLRKHKGVTFSQALKLLLDHNYFATMMVECDDADGMVSGAIHTTPDTIRPALQLIKTKDGIAKASSFFIMVSEEGEVYFFTDCAFIPHPTADDLAESAILTADAAKSLGINPRIAMLSFSTKGSAHDPSADKIIKATHIVQQQRPDLCVDGELQLDAAIVPEVAQQKCPNSPLKGQANILVFPSLNSGNIGYKLVERFAHARPVGPVIIGLNKPVNDVSRGCDVDQIVLTACITAIEGDFS